MKKNLVIILKNPGTSCNIGCIYCAEERKKYISVENRITEEQITKLANLTREYSLNVLFHGGEPTLLSCDYYCRLMEIFESINDDVYFGIQTNATTLNSRWIEFLKQNRQRLGVSVSLDGPGEINRFRLTKDKKETYEIVRKNIKLLEENGIKTGMICTIVSSALGKERELFNMLNEFNNLQFVKLNPCMDRNDDGTVPFWGITPQEYFGFVSNFFDIMIKESAWSNFYLEPVISILKNIQGVKSTYCNYSREKCSNFISVYPDGTITTCDNFNLQNGYIGNLNSIIDFDSIRFFQTNSELSDVYSTLSFECKMCDYESICNGGCIAARQRYSDSNEYCKGVKMLIDHIKEVYSSVI